MLLMSSAVSQRGGGGDDVSFIPPPPMFWSKILEHVLELTYMLPALRAELVKYRHIVQCLRPYWTIL